MILQMSLTIKEAVVHCQWLMKAHAREKLLSVNKFETHISCWSSEETLTPKCICLCNNLTLFELQNVVHLGKICSILETCSGERTDNNKQIRTRTTFHAGILKWKWNPVLIEHANYFVFDVWKNKMKHVHDIEWAFNKLSFFFHSTS